MIYSFSIMSTIISKRPSSKTRLIPSINHSIPSTLSPMSNHSIIQSHPKVNTSSTPSKTSLSTVTKPQSSEFTPINKISSTTPSQSINSTVKSSSPPKESIISLEKKDQSPIKSSPVSVSPPKSIVSNGNVSKSNSPPKDGLISSTKTSSKPIPSNGKSSSSIQSKPTSSPPSKVSTTNQSKSSTKSSPIKTIIRRSSTSKSSSSKSLITPIPNLPKEVPIKGIDPVINVIELSNEEIIPPIKTTMARKEICVNTGGAIGNTPIVMLNSIGKDLPAKIAVKLEYMNPAGSVKDRVGYGMIEDAEKKGLITPGKTILIEPTSGNMGIALAFVARIKGYKLILCMPASMSVERRSLLKAYGAEVILTDPATAVKGALQRARELAAAIPNAHILNQFGNPANVEAHYKSTGPEIWEQTNGKVDIVCFGVGSGGTLSGVGKYLKEQKPSVEVFPVEPFESSVINGLQHSPHKIQGMGTGFIPDILDRSLFKEALRVHSDDAIAMAKRLAKEEAILGGISSGANVCAALQLATRSENEGKLIVTNINSFGERYLSTVLYSEIKEEAEKMKMQSLEESLEVANQYVSQ